jgi:membrane protease subunit (stomatin/prohibitin family)
METINGILNKKAEFDIMGDNRYKTARGYDVLEAAASNEGGAGSIAAAGVGLGLGLGVAKSAGNISGDIIPNQTGVKTCPNCGSVVGNAKFCPDCGEKIKVTCPTCNTEIQNGKKFCPDCGTKLK